MIHCCPQADLTKICMNASENNKFYSIEGSGVIKCFQSSNEKSMCKICAKLVFNVAAQEWPDHSILLNGGNGITIGSHHHSHSCPRMGHQRDLDACHPVEAECLMGGENS